MNQNEAGWELVNRHPYTSIEHPYTSIYTIYFMICLVISLYPHYIKWKNSMSAMLSSVLREVPMEDVHLGVGHGVEQRLHVDYGFKVSP